MSHDLCLQDLVLGHVPEQTTRPGKPGTWGPKQGLEAFGRGQAACSSGHSGASPPHTGLSARAPLTSTWWPPETVHGRRGLVPLLCCWWACRLSEFTCHCLDGSAHAHGRAALEQPCSLHPQPPSLHSPAAPHPILPNPPKP